MARRKAAPRRKIRIKASRRGVFTRKAKKAGRSVQAHARAVLAAPKGRYSAATRRQANFARNFGGRRRKRRR